MLSSDGIDEFRVVNQVRAEKSVCLSLVLQDIASRENITAAELDVRNALDEYAQMTLNSNQTVDISDPALRLVCFMFCLDVIASRREIEDSLIRVAVFDLLAETN